jgi:exodeoxyribonuclease-3
MAPWHVVSWNCENLAPLLNGAGADSLERLHATFGAPDVLCLQEVRIRSADEVLIESARAALPGFDCELALNRDPINAKFRGGRAHGVATWSRRSLGRHERIDTPWDHEGRVCCVRWPGHGFALVNVYAVNGTARPYFDPVSGCTDGDRHRFKRRFVERLAEFVAALVVDGGDLLLIGDWNVSQSRLDTWPRLRTEEPHAQARKAFADDFVARFGLVDVFRRDHPDARRYTWFNARAARRGRLDAARVDFALATPALAARVVDSDIAEGPCAPSDHAPISVRLLPRR